MANSMLGTSKVSIERQPTAAGQMGHATAHQTFLKLRQPINETEYPIPRAFDEGRTFRFPFTFVVPDYLLPQVCEHSKDNLHLKYAHTRLPPSLGDPMLAGDGVSLLDDMCPVMGQISYVIKVSISRKSPVEGGRPTSLASVAKKVRIIPAVDEEPPLNVPDDSHEFCLRKEKDVRKGLLRGKYGRLVIAASQPKPIQCNPPSPNGSNCSASTVATLYLRFDPLADEQPPRLGTIWTKIKATTFCGVTPWDDFPTKSPNLAWTQNKAVYTETLSLSSRCLGSAQWEKHSDGNNLLRRDSMQSSSSAESVTGPSASYSGKTFYTASILVPITLPRHKTFVPTFHSCIVSRTYALDLCVSYHTPNANVLAPTSSLKIPIQITCGRRDGSAINYEDEIPTEAEVDEEFFRPRSVAPPRASLGSLASGDSSASETSTFVERSEPPEYSDPVPLPRPREYRDGQSVTACSCDRQDGENDRPREKSSPVSLILSPI